MSIERTYQVDGALACPHCRRVVVHVLHPMFAEGPRACEDCGGHWLVEKTKEGTFTGVTVAVALADLKRRGAL